MIIEILTIGDEILSGDIVDTNTSFMAGELWKRGIKIEYHTGVRDNEEKIREALLVANKRADICLVTGGLGPTADDFTIEVAAKTFKKKLIPDKKTIKYLHQLYASWGRTVSANNLKQANIPQSSKILFNKVGTAPGVFITYKKTHYFFMPGVPREMKQIFNDSVLPFILKMRKDKTVYEHVMLKCFGAGESDLDNALKDLYKNRLQIDGAQVGFRPHFPEILVKLSTWDKSSAKAKSRLNEVRLKVEDRIGKFVYGEGTDTLEGIVVNLFLQKKKTLATAESCTGGLIASRLTDVSGSSGFFINGVVSYSNESKMRLLDVSKEILQNFGAVSPQCSEAMAVGIRQKSKADYGLAVTGIAGPTGGSADKPVGLVYVALATSEGVTHKQFNFPRGRAQFKSLVSSVALDWLRKEV